MFKPVLGILGGGQLGSLLAIAAKKLDIRTVIFSNSEISPGKYFSDDFRLSLYNFRSCLNIFICNNYTTMNSVG